jgi:hypothetical protein
MSFTTTRPVPDAPAKPRLDVVRLSAKFGVAFTVCQVGVMVLMAALVLPHEGSPSDPAMQRARGVMDHVTAFHLGNYAFMVAGLLFLGFLGAVHVRLRRADGTGVLAAVALASGTLLALVWPFAGVLHDVAIETADGGTDLRILAGWDAAAPFSLAFSALVRVFFVGAVVLALRAEGSSPWLSRIGVLLLPLSLVGSATLLAGGLFAVLALSTLAFELWVAAVAVHWMRSNPAADRVDQPA